MSQLWMQDLMQKMPLIAISVMLGDQAKEKIQIWNAYSKPDHR
jgi:hypothetical protein